MEQTNAFEFFFSQIKTKDQLLEFIENIDKAKEEVFKREELKLTEKIDKKVSEDFKAKLKEAEEKGFLPSGPKEEEKFLFELAEYGLSLPVLKLTIAFAPGEAFFEKIDSFLAGLGKGRVILDLTVDPNIVAGAVFEFKGEFRDYSISKEIDQVLKNSKLMS